MVRFWVVGLVAVGWWLTGSPTLAGEDSFPVLKGPYFGQQEPGVVAQPFAPGLVSLPGRYEFALSFSPAGDELLFTQQVPEQTVSVYHSRLEGGAWTEPATIRLSDGARREEMEAFFAPDGERIFFAPYDEGMDVRIWSLELGPDGWRNPRELASPVADDPAFYPTLSYRGTLYYTNLAARRVYRAELEGLSVSSVEDAGLEFGGHAFIAPDESFVLLDARDHDSLGGSDIYVAFRLPDGTWARPHHLGAEVNSAFDETCPSLSADGKYLFFSRYDEPDEVSDIYWIDSAVIDAARKEVTAEEAFRLLTQLEGSWLGSGGSLGTEPVETVHELTVAAGDSVVMEVMDPGGERELNVYHLVEGDLMLTHYCGAGIQPRLKLDISRAAPGVLPFVLVDGSGFDPDTDRHIHSVKLVVRHGGHLESWWTAEKEGQVVMESRFVLERASEKVGFEAALEGDLERMKALLAEDSERVHAANESGKTVLHYAAQGGHVELVEYLLQAGANVDSANDAGETPLHYATALGHVDVVRVLLASGATVAVLDIDNNTPLHHAALSGVVEIARLLIGEGADVDAANYYGYKPLDVAYRNERQEMCGFLEAQGGTRIAIEEPEVAHLSGSVYRITFPFGDVSNIGLSAGVEGFLLVDTGFSDRAVGKLRKALGDLGDGPVKIIINTHEHRDHVAGNSIGGESSVIIDFNNLEQRVADGVLAMGRDPIKGKSGKSFEVYYTLAFNGEEVRLIPYAGIHTDADLLVHFTRSGVVHMGDLLILQSFPSVTQKTGEYLELLEKVVDIFPESTRFICGHGQEGTVADVAEYHGMLAAAAEIIRSSLAAGKKKRTILEEKALQPYDQWGEFIPVLNTEYWFNAVVADYPDSLE